MNMKMIRWISAMLVLLMICGCAVAEDAQAIVYDLSNLENFTELSGYYYSDLASAVEALGLSFSHESDGMSIYANDCLMLGGKDVVDTIMLLGGEYTVYGAAAGMDFEAAMQLVRQQGFYELEMPYSGSVVFMRPATADSINNVDGYDSSLDFMPFDGILSMITWHPQYEMEIN